MTAAQLRAVTNHVLSCSDVRFVLTDGTRVEIEGWRTDRPEPNADGKPTGTPTLVIVLRETKAVPTSGPSV